MTVFIPHEKECLFNLNQMESPDLFNMAESGIQTKWSLETIRHGLVNANTRLQPSSSAPSSASRGLNCLQRLH